MDMIELDVYKSDGDNLVIIHDDKVDRTTNGKGYVWDKNLEEMRSLDAGNGEKVPTLKEVLDLVDRKTKVNIELKGVGTAEIVAKTINEYVENKNWEIDDFLVSSFNHPELAKFKKILPEVKIGALITAIPIDYAQFAKNLNAYSVNPCIEFVDENFVEDAHEKGLKVFVWTVNDLDDIERMEKLGVDGIFINFPDRL